MLRAGQLLPPKGLLTLRFSTGRFPPALAACYRASWQLPGPDFHRLADTSLRVNHLNVTTSWSSLCTHAAGHTKLGLVIFPACHRRQRVGAVEHRAGRPVDPDGEAERPGRGRGQPVRFLLLTR